MKQPWMLTLALATALSSGAAYAARERHTRLPEGSPVVIVGQISSPPRGAINEQKMQVAVGPRRVDYTLHFGDGVVRGPRGRNIDEDKLDDGQWVRAEGRIMDDPRRIKVHALKVISKNKLSSLRGTPYYRRGLAQGYLAWPTPRSRVAGQRYYYRAPQ
jgi:hypothetical protein